MFELKTNVLSCVEEPGDRTRYSHVFEFSWNKTQACVHKHPFDNGCTLKNDPPIFMPLEQVYKIGEDIRDMDRKEMIEYLRKTDIVKGIFGNENINTVGSVCRCLDILRPQISKM